MIGLYGLVYIFFIEIAPTASVRLRNSPRGIFDLLKVAFARHKVPEGAGGEYERIWNHQYIILPN